MQILYSALKNRSESLTDENCITGLFKYKNPVSPPHKKIKTSLEKMVATELLKLAMETEEERAERKERLKKMVANHSPEVSP